jgi:hypothetical protein
MGFTYNTRTRSSCIILYDNLIRDFLIEIIEDNTDNRYIAMVLENGNEYLILWNVYAPPDAQNRKVFLKNLSEKIYEIEEDITERYHKNVKSILGGDFNATINEKDRNNKNYHPDKNYQKFLNKHNLTDIWRDSHKADKIYTYQKGEIDSRIDHWLAEKPYFTKFQSFVHDRCFSISDSHSFIELRLEIEVNIDMDLDDSNKKNKSCTERKRIKMNKHQIETELKDFSFSKDIDEYINKIKCSNTSRVEKENYIDLTFSHIVEEIYQTLKRSEAKYVNNSKIDDISKDYKIQQLSRLKKKMFHYYTKLNTRNENENQAKLQTLSNELKKHDINLDMNKLLDTTYLKSIETQVCKKRRRRLYSLKSEKIKKNIDKISKLDLTLKQISMKIKRINNNKNCEIPNYVFGDDKKIHRGKKDMIQAYKNYWEKIFRSINKHSLKNFLNDVPIHKIGDDFSCATFTCDEFWQIIDNLKMGKSPGPNGLTNEMITSLPKTELFKLLYIYKQVWKYKYIPKPWNDSNITLINKGTNVCDVSDYRPITLQNVDMKIFAKIVQMKVESLNRKYNIIDELQFGFQNNQSTAQPIISLINILEDAKQHDKELHICLIDFTKAFDCVEWDILIEVMKKYNYPDDVIDIIRNFLINRKTRIKTPLGFTRKFNISRGTPQGDPISATLFLIFINPLLQKIRDRNLGYSFSNNSDLKIPFLAYADDIALITESIKNYSKLLKKISTNFSTSTNFNLAVQSRTLMKKINF